MPKATSTAAPRNLKIGKAGKPAVVVASKPVATPAPVILNAAKPAPSSDKLPAVDIMPRGLTRDAAGIAAARTNFEQYSGRDDAYLRFFGTVARQHNGVATLRQIHDAGTPNGRKRLNPFYTGSAKATDVGAVNRQIKAGYFTRSADGHTLTATPLAKAHALYNKA